MHREGSPKNRSVWRAHAGQRIGTNLSLTEKQQRPGYSSSFTEERTPEPLLFAVPSLDAGRAFG